MDKGHRDLLQPGVLVPQPAVAGVDLSVPSAARVYDYFLGGAHNFPADRDLAERVLETAPWVRDVAHANRRFLQRAVRYLVDEAGVRQFLDLGSGIPTVGNVHAIAHQAKPRSRVVYVDVDPVAVASSRHLLAEDDRVLVLEADLRDTETVLSEAAAFLDFERPVAVLMVSVLLFIPDNHRPGDIVARYMTPLTSDSHLAISHPSDDHAEGPLREQIQAVSAAYATSGTPVVARSHDQITTWFTDLELVAPGVVILDDWRPDSDVHAEPNIAALSYGGVARKPSRTWEGGAGC